jgi:UDP-N-acetylmuramoyl-tripeptide--D-alanyl-D-alanine ligase
MKPLTLQQIRQAVGGRALSRVSAETPLITAICTDTRQMQPSSLFVALRGERFNANQLIPAAAAGGAIAAVVDEVPDVSLPNVHLIKVDNTRKALGKLATYVRKGLKSKIIAVAGSNGKTSTKLLIDAALSGKLRGSVSPRSFNNDIGVPLAIFPADPMADYLVLEMGTNHHGEIKVLTDMALPDIAVITNVGAEHLEGLDDLMGVRRENATIISGLNPRGGLVINGDDPQLLEAVGGYAGPKVTFGFGENNDLFATDISWDHTGTRFCLNGSARRIVRVPMIGKHTAANALAALAVARRMGVSEDQAIVDLAEARGPDMRMQRQEVGAMTVINDAYNANPSSMKAGLETVAGLPAPGRRVAILGDMRELGNSTERYHRELGAFAASCKFDLLICVGASATWYVDGARHGGMDAGKIHHYPDAHTLATEICQHLRPDDLVFLKASRSVRLEEVATTITEGHPQRFFPLAAAG